MFDVFVSVRLRLSYADVVNGLLLISSLHLSVLVYLCNKLVLVVALAFVYFFHVNDISLFCVTILCILKLYMSGETYRFKLIPNDRFLRKRHV